MDEYSNAKILESGFNSKALNAIRNRVDINQFELMSMCTIEKEVWYILQDIHEGDNMVKFSKL